MVFKCPQSLGSKISMANFVLQRHSWHICVFVQIGIDVNTHDFFSNLDVNTEIHMDISKSLEEMNSSHGCFLKWWVFPQNIPK